MGQDGASAPIWINERNSTHLSEEPAPADGLRTRYGHPKATQLRSIATNEPIVVATEIRHSKHPAFRML
jgi:hypothetical protein